MPTIFTKIINKEIPADIVFEDDKCVAFKDINPVAPIHLIIVPKKEIPSLAEATSEDHAVLGHILIKSAEIAKKLGVSSDGYRLVLNTNKAAGQEVFHIHFHFLAGRKFSWPPG